MADIGFGSTLKIDLPAAGSLIAIPNLTSITPPNVIRTFIEFWELDGSPIVPGVIPSKMELGEFSFTGNVSYDVSASETAWQLLMAERDRLTSDTPIVQSLSVELTIKTTFVTDPVFTFEAYVNNVELGPLDTDGLQSVTVTMKLSTLPALAAPAAV